MQTNKILYPSIPIVTPISDHQKTKSYFTKPKIAIVIPCYNEEKTIAKVVKDFKKELPNAEIIVYDNNSSDNSVKIALENKATVLKENKQGKGNVVRSMFDNVDADIYVMVDGDDTYPADAIKNLVNPVLKKEADMVVGARLKDAEPGSLSKLHYLGNKLLTSIFNISFKTKLTDIESGYRVFSDQLIKNLVISSNGFGIETEITAHSLEKGFRVKEIDVKYRARPEGSISKLKTFRDGFVVINAIFSILRDYKPLRFFLVLGSIFVSIGLFFGLIVIYGYILTGIVSRLPLSVASTSFILLGVLTSITGFVVDTINRKSQENFTLLKRMISKISKSEK